MQETISTDNGVVRDIEFGDNNLVKELYGDQSENLKEVENRYGIRVHSRGGKLSLEGDAPGVDSAYRFFKEIYGLLEKGYVLDPADIELAARAQQRHVSETLRWVPVPAPAREVQRPHGGVAVERRQQCRRAAGGVIARLALALEQQHAPALGQGRRGRGAGGAAADDDDVELVAHCIRSQWEWGIGNGES